MKILNISLDKNIIDKNSAVAKRIVEYGNLVDKYAVIVPAGKKEKIELSDRVGVYSVGGGNKIAKLLNCYFQAKNLISKEMPDVITVQDQYYLGWVALKLAKKFKIGLEVQIHGFEKYSGLRKMIAKRVIKNANAIRVVSERLRKKIIEKFRVEEKKITVVPIYSEITIHDEELVMHEDKFIFLTVGRLVPVKNIEMQIKAMEKITKENKKIELWIAGDGEEREKLEVKSKKLKLEKNIKFLGWQDDLNYIYKKADAFLLTSSSEGWGLVVVEAASFGLPIIMTDVGCAGEVIKGLKCATTNGAHSNEDKNESGIVISVGDQKSLEEAMSRLMTDEGLRKKMGKNAQEVIKKLPTKEEIFQKYLESWEKSKLVKS